jgi:phosphoesterase RecJ-like protein
MNKIYRRRSEAEVAGYLSIPMNTLVVYHARPDGDTVGCAIALAEAMKALGSRAYFTGVDEVPERLRFLCPDDFVSAKYENLPSDFTPERIITVDAAAPELVGDIYDELCGRIDLMIDHHEFNSTFADNCIDHTAAACGEIVKRIIFMMFEHPTDIPSQVLDCIYAAISSDTGCFKYSNVTPDTHKTAAGLICLGVNAAEINTLLFDTKSEKQLRAESLAASRMRLYGGGKISVVTFPYALKEENSLLDEHLETIVDIARCVSGVLVAVAVKQPHDDDRYRVSLRSNCALDVSRICAHFGGGGHKKAAGCTIVADSLDEVTDRVLSQIHV